MIYIAATTPVKGLGRFLAPDTTSAAMLFAIFGIRPLFGDRFEGEPWYGMYMPTQEGENIAILVGMMAALGIAIGATCMNGRATKAKKRNMKSPIRTPAPIRFGTKDVLIATFTAAAVYIGLLVAMAGVQILGQLRQGRSAELAIGGIPEIVMIIPMTGSISTAVFLLASRKRRILIPEVIILVIAIFISILLVSQLGNRRFIIPAVLIPVIAALIRRPSRVRPWHLIAATISVLMLAIIPMVRAAGARHPDETMLGAAWRYLQKEGLSGTIKPVFVSYDTEMFDYIAILAPKLSQEGFGWGRGILLEFISRPAPGGMTTATSWSDALLTKLFGGGCGDPFCPVPSFPGVLYFDGGLVAVALGSLIMGALLRLLAIAWQYNANLSFTRLMTVVIASAFALIAMRTNTVHAAWWCIYAIGISYAVYLYALSRRPARRRRYGPNSDTRRMNTASEEPHSRSGNYTV